MRHCIGFKHFTVRFQHSSLSWEDVSSLIYDSDGIWWSRVLNVLCSLCRTWPRHLMSRWVLVFYGSVPASHWQQHPQGINLYKSRGIRKGSCAMLVIYVFINNRKELWRGLVGSGPLLWNSQPEEIKVAKVGIIFKSLLKTNIFSSLLLNLLFCFYHNHCVW